MNMGGDAAERLVRDSLMITEEAVKLAGLGAKNLAALLVALAKEEEKTHGPTRLTRLLRSGEELKLLPIKSEDLRQFRRLAKEYGILFCPIKNKSLDNGLNDILFPASAAASINRVLEHMGYPVPREKAVEVKKEAARGRSGSASQTRGHGSDSNASDPAGFGCRWYKRGGRTYRCSGHQAWPSDGPDPSRWGISPAEAGEGHWP